MPRFKEPHFSHNQRWLPQFRALAEQAGCTLAQLALAWVLRQCEHVHVIPGTTSTRHLEDNMGALDVEVAPELAAALEALINPDTVSGARYPVATQAEIDTELLPSEAA